MQNNESVGWTEDMRDIAESFLRHQHLLNTLLRLGDIVPNPGYMILQRDFEQKTWDNIRFDGE